MGDSTLHIYWSNSPGQAPTPKIAMTLLPYTQQRIMEFSKPSLESGADAGAQNGKNQTPLDVGSVSKNRKVARYLTGHIRALDLWGRMDVAPLDENPHSLAPDARLASVGTAKHPNISGGLGKTWLYDAYAERNVEVV